MLSMLAQAKIVDIARVFCRLACSRACAQLMPFIEIVNVQRLSVVPFTLFLIVALAADVFTMLTLKDVAWRVGAMP